MSGTTSVPIPAFTANGFIVPAQSAIVAGLTADWNAAFGGNMNVLQPSSPQGQLIASQAAILGNAQDQMVALFNGVDPDRASGLMQDAIGEIYFIQRLPAQPTALLVTCGGREGVVIAANSFINDNSGNIYFNPNQATIFPLLGLVNVNFQAVNTGPIPVPAVVTIFNSSASPGWNTVTVVTGVVGRDIENQTAFELRRRLSVSGNAQSTISTIYSVVAAVPNVTQLFVIDNPQPIEQNFPPSGTPFVTLPPNSLYVCVAGAYDPMDVARAIYAKKPVGVPYFPGNMTQNVTDPNPIYMVGDPPVYIGPTTAVSFEKAVGVPICFNVTMFNPTVNPAVPSNAQDLVAQAIQNAFNGLTPGSTAASIGSIIFSYQPYIHAINALGPWAYVTAISIGCGGPGLVQSNIATFTGHIDSGTPGTAGTTLTITGGVTGTIVVGMFLFEPTEGIGGIILPGTRIVSGAGSSWTVSTSQLSIASIPGLIAVTPDQTAVSMQINWTPTFQNADMFLTLTPVP